MFYYVFYLIYRYLNQIGRKWNTLNAKVNLDPFARQLMKIQTILTWMEIGLSEYIRTIAELLFVIDGHSESKMFVSDKRPIEYGT
jgi:hypothetical protein